jgi:DNA repair photolyase
MIAQKASVIYEPRGKAREYAPLAVNLYKGCSHRCVYCYAPAATFTNEIEFSKPEPRKDILTKIEIDATRLEFVQEKGPVLLCFTCDPYQPIDLNYMLSREAITILHNHRLNVMILTKGGKRAERDFDLLTAEDKFGVTLTTLDSPHSLEWEPGAALPEERIDSLRKAHNRGIGTWVSLEPVIYPDIALEIIRQTHTYVDMFKVGPLNYHPHGKTIDWHKFAQDVEDLLNDLGCIYYLKEDLRKWL